MSELVDCQKIASCDHDLNAMLPRSRLRIIGILLGTSKSQFAIAVVISSRFFYF